MVGVTRTMIWLGTPVYCKDEWIIICEDFLETHAREHYCEKKLENNIYYKTIVEKNNKYYMKYILFVNTLCWEDFTWN